MKGDLSPVPFPNGKGCLLAKVNALRELQSPSLHFGDDSQSASGEELSHRDAAQSAMTPSVLDKAFKGEL